MDNDQQRQLHIMLAVVHHSPFSRSIWAGILKGFQALGHSVQVVDATEIPVPDDDRKTVDLFFAVHGYFVPIEKVQAYRAAGVTTAVYLLDEPYVVDHSTGWSRHYDHVFTNDCVTVPVHQQYTQASTLPLGYNEYVFKPEGPSTPSQILVLGSPFSAREPYLAALRDKWGALVTWAGPGWLEFSPVGHHHEQYLTPPECAGFYRGADIVINIHRDSRWSHVGDQNKSGLEATHLNPRFWEAAACRTLQLCSYRSDLDIFAPKCPTFRTVEEFMRKLEYFLDSKRARDENSRRVYNKVKKHTYKTRCEMILRTLEL